MGICSQYRAGVAQYATRRALIRGGRSASRRAPGSPLQSRSGGNAQLFVGKAFTALSPDATPR